MNFEFNDGGRAVYGYKGQARDCVVRAIAIAAELPYPEVYEELKKRSFEFSKGRSREAKHVAKKGGDPQDGSFRKVYNPYLKELGFIFHPTMGFGTGCRVHLKADELPAGRIIVRLSRHLAAVIDGTLLDTHDCSRAGTRCVYGYYIKET